jgi:3-mercaptopyruvate sulfurtransferase SseA
MQKYFFTTLVGTAIFSNMLWAGSVNITQDLESVEVLHKDKKVIIQRDQNTKKRLTNNFTKTSRECPPFCIQPMQIDKVKTIGELELLDFVQALNNESNTLLIDARTTEWHRASTIPGSVNLPFTMLKKDGKYIDKVLKILGAKQEGGEWRFDNVQTLLIYSNGAWDAQATTAIESLIAVGYPQDKILYYRGGMQSWQNLGLTTK